MLPFNPASTPAVESNNSLNNSSDLPEISADMWIQCAGYADATAKVITHMDQHGAADIMAANLRGTAQERMEACAAIVNSVNSHLRADEVAGMQVVPQEDGREMVIVMEESLLSMVQGLTITGNLAVQLATSTFYICNSYRTLDPLRRLDMPMLDLN